MIDWRLNLSNRAVNCLDYSFRSRMGNSDKWLRDAGYLSSPICEDFDLNIKEHRDLYFDVINYREKRYSCNFGWGVGTQREVDEFILKHWPDSHVRFPPHARSIDFRTRDEKERDERVENSDRDYWIRRCVQKAKLSFRTVAKVFDVSVEQVQEIVNE